MGQIIFDAAVIGTGPAGASASYFLASKGLKVAVFERSALPRYKTCGGGVVYRVTEMLPFDFEEIVEKKCYKAEVVDHINKLVFTTRRETPIVLMTMRSSLDYYLLHKAVNRGAVLYDNCSVQKIDEDSDHASIYTDKGRFSARAVIAADGASGVSSKYFSPDRKHVKIPALEYEIYTGSEDYIRFSESARFDFEAAPHGYGWVFPKKDHLSVGMVSMRIKKSNLNRNFDAYLKALRLENIERSERHGYYIPLNGKQESYAFGRMLITGDAAGFADPVTAEGISNAVLSGRLAAEAVFKHCGNPAESAVSYNSSLRRSVLRELNYSRIIALLVYTYPSIRSVLFKLYGQRLSELITDIFTGDKKYSGLIKDPANYLKLLKYLFARTNNGRS